MASASSGRTTRWSSRCRSFPATPTTSSGNSPSPGSTPSARPSIRAPRGSAWSFPTSSKSSPRTRRRSMSIVQKLVNGHDGSFQPKALTSIQKLTLRFVVVGLVYFGFAVFEGMIMRVFEIKPLPFIPGKQFFAIMTAHPLVGIFGSSYSIVFGAFLFLVPFLMKKPLWSLRLANGTFWLLTVGTFVFWEAGFLSHYAPLYTLYWPLPADFGQFSALGGTFFILGIALVMLGVVLFVINIFKTITYTPAGWDRQPAGALVGSALGWTGLRNLFRKKKKAHLVPLPVAAVARGTVDVAFNSGII